MNPVFQSWAQVLTIAIVLVGALMYQAHYIDRRFDDFRLWAEARFREMDARFRALEDRLARVESRLDRIEERLEHPVLRP